MDPNFYPIDDNLAKGARTEDDAVFLVDVGGGKGYDLQDLCRKHPKLPGTLYSSVSKAWLKKQKHLASTRRS